MKLNKALKLRDEFTKLLHTTVSNSLTTSNPSEPGTKCTKKIINETTLIHFRKTHFLSMYIRLFIDCAYSQKLLFTAKVSALVNILIKWKSKLLTFFHQCGWNIILKYTD